VAGAVALVVINTEDAPRVLTAADGDAGDVTIPALCVGKADGERLRYSVALLKVTSKNRQLTPRVLLGSGRLGCWPLGQLAVCFGFTAAEMLRALGVERLDAAVPPPQLALLSKLLASQQSAQSYGAAGVSSEMLHGLGCDIGMLQTLPFGVKDIATYMGLTYTLARQMGLGAETCGTSGWSFVNVREALKLSEKQAQECGLTVARFLVLPGGR
jgi:hypothetical protein